MKNLAQFRILLRFAHAVDARDGYVAASTVAYSLEQELSRTILVENTDADAEHVYFFDFHLEEG